MKINIDLKNIDLNIRYYSGYLIKYKNELILRSINEIIRSIDTIEEEKRYAQEKFKYYIDIVDLQVRENMKGLVKIILVYKYY